jgi:hypothetical protein
VKVRSELYATVDIPEGKGVWYPLGGCADFRAVLMVKIVSSSAMNQTLSLQNISYHFTE